jgi:hypothetical protein|tara:strand:- start:574 stop:708 length:135 start_codon:yes stop_codon:yes gene_type:complete
MPKGKKGYSAKQKKIARVAPPFDKITGADFKKLRQSGKRKPKMS